MALVNPVYLDIGIFNNYSYNNINFDFDFTYVSPKSCETY